MNHMACSVHRGSGIGVPAVGHHVGPLEKQLVTLSTESSPHPAGQVDVKRVLYAEEKASVGIIK